MFLPKHKLSVERQSPKVNRIGDQKSPFRRKRGTRLDLKGLWARIVHVLGTEDPPTIARMIGVKRHAVYKWRDAKNPPDLPNLVKIAKVTGSSLHWLLMGEGPKAVDKSLNDPYFIGVSLDPTLSKLLSELANITGRSVEDTLQILILGSLINSSLDGKFEFSEARQLFIGAMDKLEDMHRKAKKTEKPKVYHK